MQLWNSRQMRRRVYALCVVLGCNLRQRTPETNLSWIGTNTLHFPRRFQVMSYVPLDFDSCCMLFPLLMVTTGVVCRLFGYCGKSKISMRPWLLQVFDLFFENFRALLSPSSGGWVRSTTANATQISQNLDISGTLTGVDDRRSWSSSIYPKVYGFMMIVFQQTQVGAIVAI